MVHVSVERFEELVSDALDAVPDELARLIDNVAVFVEDEADGDPDLLGIYEGVPHTERADYGVGFVMPDRMRRTTPAVGDTDPLSRESQTAAS